MLNYYTGEKGWDPYIHGMLENHSVVNEDESTATLPCAGRFCASDRPDLRLPLARNRRRLMFVSWDQSPSNPDTRFHQLLHLVAHQRSKS